MKIKYHSSYKRGNTKFWVLHHTGGFISDPDISTQNLTVKNINSAHKDRWNFKSSLGWYVGYNFYIEIDGKLTQTRAIGEETIAVKGYNFKGLAISIGLAGNFTQNVDTPTFEQKQTLLNLMDKLPQVNSWDIVPHRTLQTTECFGYSLPDNWARNLYLTNRIKKLTFLIRLLTKVLDLMRRVKRPLGGFGLEDIVIDLRG